MKRFWNCLLLVSLLVPTGLITTPQHAVIRPRLIIKYFVREQRERTEKDTND